MTIQETHIVPTLSGPIRLSDYTADIFTIIPSRKGMKKAIRKELVLVNGNIAATATVLNGGETIALLKDEQKPTVTLNLTLRVIFEDEHLAVIYKPGGIEVSGNKKHTVVNALSQSLQPSNETDALPAPIPAHRLDYATSGLLLIGKTRSCLTALNQLFEHKNIQKTYHALCMGNMPEKGIIDTPVFDKPAHTEFEVIDSKVLEKYPTINLVQLHPSTGRKHQLRVHLKQLGFPIVGDQTYGNPTTDPKVKGLHLHASSLEFSHPITNISLQFTEALPKRFKRWFPKA